MEIRVFNIGYVGSVRIGILVSLFFVLDRRFV